jgi:hypothetical protein
MASHPNSSGLEYELNIMEHDSDYYSHSKVRVIRNPKRSRGVPLKGLINILLMVFVSIVAIAVVITSLAKAI